MKRTNNMQPSLSCPCEEDERVEHCTFGKSESNYGDRAAAKTNLSVLRTSVGMAEVNKRAITIEYIKRVHLQSDT